MPRLAKLEGLIKGFDLSGGNGKWAVIFDVDGTMVDNAAYHENAWIELGRRYDLGITRQFYRENIHSRSNDKNVKRLFADKATPEMIERISNEKEEIYRDSFRPVLVEIPGLTSLLEALYAEGVRCAAASNSPKGNVDMVLDELGIRKYFAAVIDRDMVSTGKPDPEIFLRAAEKTGVAADKCIVVEDSVSGFAAADNAQMPYIVITHGADAEELKHATSAQAMFRDFTEVTPEVLYELFG